MIVKKYTKVALMFLLVLALFASGFQTLPAAAAEQSGQGTISIVGSKEIGNLLSETPIQFVQDETAFDALVHAVGAKNVDASDTSFGKSINGIMGLSSKDTYYWAFYVNGIAAPVGSSSYHVHDGDQLGFRYVDWTKPSDSVSLKVIGKNGQSLYDSGQYNIGIAGEPTALQLLQVTISSDKVGLKDTQYGPMITSIDGTSAEGNSYWAFYVNGQYASVGADSYKLQPNDQITFKLETSTSPGDNTNANGDLNSDGGSNSNNSASAGESISAAALQKAVNSTSKYTLKNWYDENIWGAIALKKIGIKIPSSFLSNAKQVLKKNNGQFHYVTDAEKYALGILAAGADPTNISGYNLVKTIYNGDVTKQGTNGVVYALISLNSANFPIPSSATWTKEKLINQLLNIQLQDGHWSLNTIDSSSDIDITAMVLTALAPYKDQTEVKRHISKALDYLSSQYLAGKVDNSATAAQIVIALSSLGLDANDTTFTKDHVSVIQYLMSFQQDDGGFGYKAGNNSDAFSTPQAFEALVAYQLYKNNKGYLYHFPVSANSSEQTATKPAKRNQAVSDETAAKRKQTSQSVSNKSAANQKKTSQSATAQTAAKQTKTSQAAGSKGNTLPNTATNAVNFLMAGILLMMAGILFVYLNRKRKA